MPTASDPVATFRARGQMWVGRVGFVVTLIVFVPSTIGAANRSDGAAVSILVVVGIAVLALTARLALLRVTASSDGLTAVNIASRSFVPWSEVAAIGAGRHPMLGWVGRVQTADGGQVWLTAIAAHNTLTHPDPTGAMESDLAELASLAEGRGAGSAGQLATQPEVDPARRRKALAAVVAVCALVLVAGALTGFTALHLAVAGLSLLAAQRWLMTGRR